MLSKTVTLPCNFSNIGFHQSLVIKGHHTLEPMIKRLLLISLFFSSPLIYAETIPANAPWYEVEIILFEHSEQSDSFKEHLAEQAIIPELVGAVELTAPFSGTSEAIETAYQRLSATQLQLKSQVRYLEKNSNYRLLQHLGWRQPGLERGVAPAVLIYPYANNEETTLENYLALANELPTLAASDTEWQERVYAFGYIRLFLSRYLHVENNLLLSIPMQIASAHFQSDGTELSESPITASYNSPYQYLTETTPTPLLNENAVVTEYRYFHIDESRRVRKNELHYFDHPRFGMLLVVRDYNAPEEAP